MDAELDLSWLPIEKEGHMFPSKKTCDAWRQIKEMTDFKSVTEIGFNVGHSSSIMLSLFDDVTVTAYDIAQYAQTIMGEERVKERFGNRFQFICYNSYYLRKHYLEQKIKVEKTDLFFIDGNHRTFFAESDLRLAKEIGFKYVLIDDYDLPQINKLAKKYFSTFIKSWKYDCQHNPEKFSKVKMVLCVNDV